MNKWFNLRKEMYMQIGRSSEFQAQITKSLQLIIHCIKADKKIFIFGNGGSAEQAEHFAAELMCQFEKKRKALAALALTENSAFLTAQSNDYGYKTIFSRQLEALCSSEDLVIGITTSDVKDGHSENIEEAFKMAKSKKAKIVGLFSERTKKLLRFVDASVVIPRENTALIQEGHLSVIHLLCKLIEDEI